jgi:hypothetical protein
MVFLNTNFTTLFYWLCVADNAKGMFLTFIIIFSVVCIASTITFFVGREDDGSCPKDGLGERAKKWMWWGYPFLILFWSLYIFTPSKKDALLIVAGGQTMNFLSTDSSAKKVPAELTKFILVELKNMAKEAKVELDIQTQKEEILKSVENMSAKDLLQKMQTDSNFTKIILDK